VDAIGQIRARESIDALLEIWRSWNMMQGLNNVLVALRKLTDQDHGLDRDAWMNWWRKNKASFKFE
ncbi:MAG: hypothetical protein ACYTHN_22685, partial [Planctomycetota bacterium]